MNVEENNKAIKLNEIYRKAQGETFHSSSNIQIAFTHSSSLLFRDGKLEIY